MQQLTQEKLCLEARGRFELPREHKVIYFGEDTYGHIQIARCINPLCPSDSDCKNELYVQIYFCRELYGFTYVIKDLSMTLGDHIRCIGRDIKYLLVQSISEEFQVLKGMSIHVS